MSENKYHEDVFLVDWFLWTLVALGVLCCLCCLVGCVLRCSMRRTFTRLTRIEKRLRYELAMTKVRAGEPLDEEEAAAAAGRARAGHPQGPESLGVFAGRGHATGMVR